MKPAGWHSGQHRGSRPHQPEACRPCPMAPKPHGLPRAPNTCPQPVARQEESNVLGHCCQVSGAALGLGPRELVPAQCLQSHL